MTSPIKIQCPSCDGTLKLPSRSAEGKRVRCPKCDHAFVVELPPEEEVDEFADFGDIEEESGDEFEDEFAPPARRSERRSPPPKKSKGKGKKKAAAWKRPALIGGGVAAALLAAGLIFWLTGSAGASGGGKVDMTWLPEDAEVVMSVRAGEILRTPTIQQLLAAPDAHAGVAEAKRALGLGEAESLDEIESVVFGAAGLSQNMRPTPGGFGFQQQPLHNDTSVIVLRKRSPWDVEAIKRAGREANHEGKTYLVGAFAGEEMASHFPDDRTRVMAKEAYLKQILSRGGGSSSRARFEFVDFGRDFVFAAAVSDAAAIRGQFQTARQFAAASPEAADLIEPLAEGFQGFAFGANLSGDMDMLAQVNFAERGQASRFSGGLEKALDQARDQMGAMKMMMPPDQSRIVEEVMDTVDVSYGGSTATIAMEFPESARQQIEQAVKQGMRQFPGAALGGTGLGGSAPGGGGLNAAADAARSNNNLKMIGLAIHNYHDAFGQLPVAKGDPSHRTPGGRPHLSWRVHILPQLGHQQLYDQFRLNEPWDSPHNRALAAQIPQEYQSPGAPPEKTSYLGAAGPGGIFQNGGGVKFTDVVDGLTNTVMVIEAPADRAVVWTQPDDFDFNPGSPLAAITVPPAGLPALFGDGAVQRIAPNTPPDTVRLLFQYNDGQAVNFP